ncbi:MAG TPA: Plug domain-containing protein [Rhizomicrobium sp.]|jgi:hypothetical protein|nr:Plug domain-containing protein [Rhizomicrobium sp.]
MFRSLLFLGAAAIALFASPALAQEATESTETVTVTAEKLAAARNGIQTQTGASTYTITSKDIQAQPGGDNAQLNSVVLQMPGVAQDSFGQLHIRGEHNSLQYRLNGIILPESISVFGQTLDPRLAESVRLITGALPAEYGLQAEGAWHVFTGHTIRFGLLYQADDTLSRTTSEVLATAPGGVGNPNTNPLCADPTQTCQTSTTPLAIADNGSKHSITAPMPRMNGHWRTISPSIAACAMTPSRPMVPRTSSAPA